MACSVWMLAYAVNGMDSNPQLLHISSKVSF